MGCQSEGVCLIKTTSAELFIVNIDGQINELHSLVKTLLLIAFAGLLLALGLGLFIARTALHPLEEVTDEIEEVAETSDMSHRIAEGGADELGRLRRVFNRLMSSVQNSQTLQRQLVLDASHELRTPLTSLRTNAQVLSRARDLSEHDLHQISEDVVAQIDELAALVTDLGELARGERSEGPVVALSLDECVDECVDTARTHARVKDITIDAVVEPSVGPRSSRPSRAGDLQPLDQRRQVHAPRGPGARHGGPRCGQRRRQRPRHLPRGPPLRVRPLLALGVGALAAWFRPGTVDRGPGRQRARRHRHDRTRPRPGGCAIHVDPAHERRRRRPAVKSAEFLTRAVPAP